MFKQLKSVEKKREGTKRKGEREGKVLQSLNGEKYIYSVQAFIKK